MDINFAIKNWKIQKDDKGNQKVIGTYELLANNKVLATQSFNEGYNSMEIPFSSDLIIKLQALEQDILGEIKKMIG